MDNTSEKASPCVLAFDIFGTVVVVHDSIVCEVGALHPQGDANAFAPAGFPSVAHDCGD